MATGESRFSSIRSDLSYVALRRMMSGEWRAGREDPWFNAYESSKDIANETLALIQATAVFHAPTPLPAVQLPTNGDARPLPSCRTATCGIPTAARRRPASRLRHGGSWDPWARPWTSCATSWRTNPMCECCGHPCATVATHRGH